MGKVGVRQSCIKFIITAKEGITIMKKLAILAVLAVMVLGLAGTASAVDLEAKGQFQFQANIADNFDFLSAKDNGQREDDLNFWFRARTQFRFIANENLMSELYFEYKTRVGATAASIAGGATGNMVLGDLDAGALAISTPITDQIAVSVGYVRAYDVNATDQSTYGVSSLNQKEELDLFYAAVPVTIDGLEATPYFMYGAIGKDTFSAVATLPGLTTPGASAFNKNVSAWWAGTSFSLN